MHSIYLGIWAFINAAGGSPPLSSEAVVCSLTEFILWLLALLFSTLRHREHPPAPGARDEGKRQRKQKSHVLLGSVVSQLMGSISFLCPPVHEALCPPASLPCPGAAGREEEGLGFTLSDFF